MRSIRKPQTPSLPPDAAGKGRSRSSCTDSSFGFKSSGVKWGRGEGGLINAVRQGDDEVEVVVRDWWWR